MTHLFFFAVKKKEGFFNNRFKMEKSNLPTLPSTIHGPFSNLLLSYRTNNGNYIYQYKLPSMEKAPWPRKTDIWCKHCSHPFDTMPIPIPATIDRKRDVYGVYNKCCSVGCAAAWLRDHPFPDSAYQRSLLATMATEVFDITEPIRSAPPQDRLIVYGGDLTIEEFRNYTNSGIQSLMRDIPFVQHPMVIEDHIPISLLTETGSQINPSNNVHLASCEEDILMQDEPMTASGSVPSGGLYGDFLKEKEKSESSSSDERTTTVVAEERISTAGSKTRKSSRVSVSEKISKNNQEKNSNEMGGKKGRRGAVGKKTENSELKRTSPGGGTLMDFMKQPPNKKTKM